MLIFLIKQIMSVRTAIVGRNEPAQLAWGLAFGVLLGIVPHGNLLAVALLVLLLSLRVNHGMATVAAVASTYLATRLDPYSHQLGTYVLTHEDYSRHFAFAWQLPFVPWTDINNTIVTGSFLIGVASLVPIFLITYPVFHLFAPKGTPIDGGTGGALALALPVGSQSGTQSATTTNTAVSRSEGAVPATQRAHSASSALAPSAIDAAMSGSIDPKAVSASSPAEPHLIETRIDVIRMGSRQDAVTGTNKIEKQDISEQDEPMSEALNYLLRQLRDSRERRAA
jgi:uncharacterized protein (TIGR03546 family)